MTNTINPGDVNIRPLLHDFRRVFLKKKKYDRSVYSFNFAFRLTLRSSALYVYTLV